MGSQLLPIAPPLTGGTASGVAPPKSDLLPLDNPRGRRPIGGDDDFDFLDGLDDFDIAQDVGSTYYEINRKGKRYYIRVRRVVYVEGRVQRTKNGSVKRTSENVGTHTIKRVAERHRRALARGKE